jgi:hypothetical protein
VVAEAGVDATPSATIPDFVDLFNRGNGGLGNGWVEKKAGVYAIANQTAAMGVDSQPFYDSFVSRPAAEAQLNVDITVDYAYPPTFAADPGDWPDPALYARIQPDSAAAGSLTAYSFYVYPDIIGITREESAQGSIAILTAPVTPTLTPGQTYHLRFVVKGTNPVQLEGTLSTTEGATIQVVNTADTDANSIRAAGSYGFGSGIGANGHWDNFKRVALAN